MTTKKLKDYYNVGCARTIAEKVCASWAKFPQSDFIEMVQSDLRGKEFLARQDVFAHALELTLPTDYSRSLDILVRTLGEELQTSEGMFKYGWWLWPIGRYVERGALKDPERSLAFIYELTKRFTGEFAVRPILREHPRMALRVMNRWSKDTNLHVRRLASEGIRVSLPWAKKLPVFFDFPDECTRILSNLKTDSVKFVQKSVGNNLNDLIKEDRTFGMKIITAWKTCRPLPTQTAWIIKHGQRSLRVKD